VTIHHLPLTPALLSAFAFGLAVRTTAAKAATDAMLVFLLHHPDVGKTSNTDNATIASRFLHALMRSATRKQKWARALEVIDDFHTHNLPITFTTLSVWLDGCATAWDAAAAVEDIDLNRLRNDIVRQTEDAIRKMQAIGLYVGPTEEAAVRGLFANIGYTGPVDIQLSTPRVFHKVAPSQPSVQPTTTESQQEKHKSSIEEDEDGRFAAV
jgi:hypothetical protein